MPAEKPTTKRGEFPPWLNARGRELADQLIERGWQKAAIAKKSGQTPSAIGNLTNGKGTSFVTLAALADAFNLDRASLFDERGGIVLRLPSVSTLPGFSSALEAASKGFAPDVATAAVRMMDAIPADRFDAEVLRKLMHIAADFITARRPAFPDPGPEKKGGRKKRSPLKEEHRAVQVEIRQPGLPRRKTG